MGWTVEGTDEFSVWYDGLDDAEQASVIAVVDLLEEHSPALRFPHSSDVQGSRHGRIRNYASSIKGDRTACSIASTLDGPQSCFGGNKTGDNRWHEIHVPKADAIYDQYLEDLKKEGLL